MKKTRSKRDIEIELDAINSFALGIIVASVWLWGLLYFNMNPTDLYNLSLILIFIIIIRSIYLKIKLRGLRK